VKVSELWSDNPLLLELEVARDDLGRVIGNRGRLINAMQTLVDAASC